MRVMRAPARCSGALPLHPGGDVIPAPLTFYNIAQSVAGTAATLCAFLYKAWAGIPEHDDSLSERV